ncbi:DUF3732 domain-containing protein [Bradyrhizobium sp. SBR1B]|uniref:DUF3732 domain-containing protein n=1 Tax=Bradyrhizobium sp. SBR1B TaxID=2663836 RepID=UPI001857985C|nr:DUF3732 domain-containing protein [Bradyrhizobium sp. SBR1B]MBB4378461.1 hypothetical protein [Bradyrhizobium sp. SBR1B]
MISGSSKTGKSAVIPIIDYCLGADKCAIPVGVIRENCSWFGVLVETLEGQKLLARREPGELQRTGDMFVLDGAEVEIPRHIEERNTTVDAVKGTLNRLGGLTGLDFQPGGEGGFSARPSFRDMMAFTFQPQNIIANPNVLFFKADTTEHREKLKTIFPYVLGAVTPAILEARWELDRLQRALRRKETELRGLEAANAAWQSEARGWLRQAIELGLLPPDLTLPTEWADIIGLLRSLPSASSRATPSLEGLDVALGRLETLRTQEEEAARELSVHRQRLNELRRLLESSDAYGGALRVQRDRLEISRWLRGLDVDLADPLGKLAGADQQPIQALCDALEGLEVQLQSYPSLSDTLSKEMVRQRTATEVTLDRLNSVRREIAELERVSEEAASITFQFDRVERFLGRVEQALKAYDSFDQSSGLRAEISDLRAQISALQKTIAEGDIKRITENAIDQLQHTTSRLIPKMDAEWADAPIRLVVPELTVKVIRGGRDDYLWEIGSGANWLAYHVALIVALQEFFLRDVNHAVPGFLVFDQPSQVYFPKRPVEADEGSKSEWRDEDIAAVRKVFAVLGEEVRAARGRLQAIVLDHADEDVWGGLDGVELTEEWRGKKLVPQSWMERPR